MHLLEWSTGGYINVQLQHAHGQSLRANRLNVDGTGDTITDASVAPFIPSHDRPGLRDDRPGLVILH